MIAFLSFIPLLSFDTFILLSWALSHCLTEGYDYSQWWSSGVFVLWSLYDVILIRYY